MALTLTHLDPKSRSLMIEEIDQDTTASRLHMSPRLTTAGQAQYPTLLTEAAQTYDDAWLAHQIRMQGLLKTEETRRTPSGDTTTARVPVTAPDTLAEGEFNRFYCRAICVRAIEEGKTSVQVYRAKHVESPRPESQAKVGTMVDAKQLLALFKRIPK